MQIIDEQMPVVLCESIAPRHRVGRGVQVRHCGAWHEVAPREGAFVVNVGDMLHRWTGGYFKWPPALSLSLSLPLPPPSQPTTHSSPSWHPYTGCLASLQQALSVRVSSRCAHASKKKCRSYALCRSASAPHISRHRVGFDCAMSWLGFGSDKARRGLPTASCQAWLA